MCVAFADTVRSVVGQEAERGWVMGLQGMCLETWLAEPCWIRRADDTEFQRRDAEVLSASAAVFPCFVEGVMVHSAAKRETEAEE